MKTNFIKQICIGALLAITVTSVNAQPGAMWVSQAAYATDDQNVNDVTVAGNGDAYTVGFFKGTHTYFQGLGTTYNNADGTGVTYDGFLAKYDPATGDAVWGVTMGSDKNDYTTAVITYPEGSDYVIYVCGHFNDTMTFNSTDGTTTAVITTAGLQDAYIAKYNSSGIVQWAYRMGSATNDGAYDITVAAPSSGLGGALIYVAGVYGTNIVFNGQSANLNKNAIAGGNDAFLVQYLDDPSTPSVDPVWARAMGSTLGSDAYYAVATDGNSDAVVTGLFRGNSTSTTATFDINGSTVSTFSGIFGVTEAVAICYNSSGSRIWSDHYGSTVNTGSATDAGLSATMDLNGTSYLGGYYTGTATFGGSNYTNLGTGQDSYVISVSSTGTVQWVQTGGTANTDDMISSLAVDNCGKHVYAAGQYRGTLGFAGLTFGPQNTGAPNIDAVFMTLNASNGNGIAGDGIQTGGTDGIDNRTAVAVNALEDVYVSGTFASQNLSYGVGNNQFANANNPVNLHTDGYLYRWDNINFPALATVSCGSASHHGVGVDDCTIYAAGDFTCNATFGATSLYTSFVNDPGPLYSKDVYFTTCDKYGSYTSFLQVVKGKSNEAMSDQYVDASGNNYLCGSASPFYTTHTINYDVLFNNTTTFNISCGSAAWVCKTNSSGTVQWANWINGTGITTYAGANGVTCDANGDVYCCGYFQGTKTFSDPGGSPVNKTSASSTDMFVAKYAGSTGNLLWVQTFPATTGPGFVIANAITTLGSDYYVTGYFKGSVIFYGTTQLNSTTGYMNVFVTRGSSSTGAITHCTRYNSGNNADEAGNDIVALTTNSVYIGASLGTATAMLSKINMSIATPSWTWTRTNSSGTAVGTRVESYNGFIYLGGTCTGGTLIFGSLSAGTGSYVVRYGSGGTEVCLSSYGSTNLQGLAASPGMLNSDGGDNLVISGGSTPFIHTMGMTNCRFTARHGMLTNHNQIIDDHNKSSIENSLLTSSVFPNPMDGSATFELSGDFDLSKNPGTLMIIDMTGRVVKQVDNIVTQSTVIQTSELANGVYQYQFVSNGQTISLGKIVVQH